MGNSFSSHKKETPEQRQKRLQEAHGVLIPPSFLSPTAQMPPSCQSLCKATNTPDLLEYLWATNPGRRLLEDHLSPGVWLSVGPSADKNILVSLDTSKAVSSNSLLWVGQTWERGSIEALVPTAGQPSLTASFLPIAKLASISANLSVDGKGWVGTRLQFPKDGIHMLFGTYLPFDPRTKPSTLHAYGAAEYNQSLAAVQAEIPLTGNSSNNNNNEPLNVSTMVSLNINDDASPPLWVTLKQQRTSASSQQQQQHQQPQWTMNLSQTLNFDRHVLNVLEDRAPKVRQTLGWVVQLEHSGNSDKTPPKLSVGAAWQWNRGVGIKGVVSDQTLVYGVVLKRWKQPRVTLSILNQMNFATSKHSFLGVGVELETTGNFVAEYQTETSTMAQQQQETPVTKVQLPKEMKQKMEK
jgi:hypothetical protein